MTMTIEQATNAVCDRLGDKVNTIATSQLIELIAAEWGCDAGDLHRSEVERIGCRLRAMGEEKLVEAEELRAYVASRGKQGD